MGDGIFILSGCLALILFWLSLRALRLVAREEVEKSKRVLLPIVGILFVTFNVLYFNNMIPPIPLSLKEIGIYHTVERTLASEYRLSFEKAPWYAFGKKQARYFTGLVTSRCTRGVRCSRRLGSIPTYCTVGHTFRVIRRVDRLFNHRIPDLRRTKRRIPGLLQKGKNISGGNGAWTWETLRGQILGRFVFTVEDSAAPPVLSSEIR